MHLLLPFAVPPCSAIGIIESLSSALARSQCAMSIITVIIILIIITAGLRSRSDHDRGRSFLRQRSCVRSGRWHSLVQNVISFLCDRAATLARANAYDSEPSFRLNEATRVQRKLVSLPAAA